MLDFSSLFPLWFCLLFLAIMFVYLALSVAGIYYLISKKHDKITLILPALILLALMIPKSLNPYHWAEMIRIYSDFFFLVFVLLTYFALFAIINFLYRLFCKQIS